MRKSPKHRDHCTLDVSVTSTIGAFLLTGIISIINNSTYFTHYTRSMNLIPSLNKLRMLLYTPTTITIEVECLPL